MFGFKIFEELFWQLEDNCQIKVLRNIFAVPVVSIYDFSVRNDRIFVRIYGDDVFYQFIFLFREQGEKAAVVSSSSSRLVNCQVYVNNYVDFDERDLLACFVRILRSRDEKEIYNIISYFL